MLDRPRIVGMNSVEPQTQSSEVRSFVTKIRVYGLGLGLDVWVWLGLTWVYMGRGLAAKAPSTRERLSACLLGYLSVMPFPIPKPSTTY